MTRFSAQRLGRLGFAEIVWRLRSAADIATGRLASTIKGSAWDRRQLASALHAHGALAPVVRALHEHNWMRAHAALVTHVNAQPARFLIAPAMRRELVAEITGRFSSDAHLAAQRAEGMLSGRYDLLGYLDLPFDGHDWHRDQVHGKSAPRTFWSMVPYLDPSCGDHKIIWEINRHQHWMELGRAYWLTGDPRYRAECLRQLDSWMAANPPLMGVNWASMLELGFRALSWIWAMNFFAVPDETDQSPWLVDLLLGLDRQLTHIERHLSYYFSPNTHLLGEALALYVGGRALPELKASARREATGRRILVQEITRQITADGGHCERSAHYHRYALDFYLMALAVARVTDDPVASVFERACARLAEAARALADDNGRLPHLGDDDGGSLFPLTHRPPDDAADSLAIAAALTGRTDFLTGEPPEEMYWILAHPRFDDAVVRVERAPRPVAPASVALPATGYYTSRRDGDHLIVDAGPHGYMNGGHAHADALSLTFTRRGAPLLIDTGTGCYTVNPQTRDRFRSSELHNTLTLDARSQSIPRGPFHWQHIANGSARRWRSTQRFDYFSGTHDGYLPLVHARHVLMLHGDLLIVADRISRDLSNASKVAKASKQAAKAQKAEKKSTVARERSREESRGTLPRSQRAAVHWHLDPAWSVTVDEPGALLTTADESVELVVAGGRIEQFRGDESTGLGWHAPVYGRVEPTNTLRICSTGPAPFWIVSVFGLDPANRVHAVAVEPIDDEADAFQYVTAVRIERACASDRLVLAEPVDPARDSIWHAADLASDAAMLFTRSVGGVLTELALVDATTACSGQQCYFDRADASRVSDLHWTCDQAPGGPDHVRQAVDNRKGTECVESLDSLMVRP